MLHFAYKRKNEGYLMRKLAFSLLELILVVALVGIMAIFAAGGYRKYSEASRAKGAIAYLNAIYNAEKRYKLDTNEYYACSGPASTCSNTDFDQNHLGIFVSDPYFSYAISKNAPGAPPAFTATATRKGGGLCSGKTITFQNDISDLGTDCSIWVSKDVHSN